nr:MAG TPA: hypothetical protein [Caudoviricetes sp.]
MMFYPLSRLLFLYYTRFCIIAEVCNLHIIP